MAHWIETEARRANRNLLITNLVLLAAAVLLYFLNPQIDYRSDYVPLLIGGAVVLLAGWNCFKAFRRYSQIQISPVWRIASAYGNVEQLAAQIEQDQLMGKAKYGKLVLTPSWMIRRSFFSTWVSPIGELAWAYKKVTQHRTNFIPTGKTYAAIIVGRQSQRIEVQMSQKNTDQLLADLATRVPWAIYGFSKDLQTAWQKDPNGFVAKVDARRQQSTSKGASGA